MPPEKEYNPIFMNAIRRSGYYQMSELSYLGFTKQCAHHYMFRKTFEEWATEKKLKIIVNGKQVKIEKT